MEAKMRTNVLRKISAGVLLTAIGVVALAQSKGIDLSYMDTSANACDNFYQYANGAWLKKTEIPAAFPSWGAGAMLRERNNEILRQILEESAKNTKAAKNSDAQLIGDFYASCMDEAAIEKAGAAPLDAYLKQVAAMKSAGDLPRVLGRLQRWGVNAGFGYFVYPDFKNSASNLAYAWQAGLSLPNRDYYTKTDEKSQKLREQFQEHVTRMFQLLGDSPDKARANAAAVMKFEMRLALSSKTPVELRDPAASYNKKTFADLNAATPGFAWATYINELGSPGIT